MALHPRRKQNINYWDSSLLRPTIGFCIGVVYYRLHFVFVSDHPPHLLFELRLGSYQSLVTSRKYTAYYIPISCYVLLHSSFTGIFEVVVTVCNAKTTDSRIGVQYRDTLSCHKCFPWLANKYMHCGPHILY
jgi:hypothetical protein